MFFIFWFHQRNTTFEIKKYFYTKNIYIKVKTTYSKCLKYKSTCVKS